jgi:hypothetical protein
MFVNVGIHHVKPGKEQELLESMKRFGEAHRGHRGLIMVFGWKDESTGALIGTALWNTKEDFLAARPDLAKAVEGVDFEEIDTSTEVYRGEPVVWS